MNTYTPDSDRIVHKTTIDFKKRSVSKPIHIVQYDHSLPVLALQLYVDGVIYHVTNDAMANIRLKKPDGKVVYNPVLGCNADRDILYVEITYQMTTCFGKMSPVIEMIVRDKVAASSSIEIEVDKNPIQQGDVESTDEMKTLVKYVNDAREYSENAKDSEDNAKDSELAAKASELAAKASEDNAKDSEDNAKDSETNAAQSETAANNYKNQAANSATAAAASASNAALSEASANNSKNAAKTSEDNAKASELAAKASELAAKTSETNAGNSETNAASSATAAATSANNAESSKNQAANSATAANNSKNAAKTSEDNAKASELAAKVSEDNAKDSEENALEYAERAEATDIGRLVQSLSKHKIAIALSDSNGESILDNNGDLIMASVSPFVSNGEENSESFVFIDADAVEILVKALQSEITNCKTLIVDKVNKTLTIAGIDLQDNITKTELLAALNVEDGAQKNIVISVAGKTGAVTLSKSDVGLGSVVNTGDSATPVSGGTTKFTTGGAYTELNKKLDKTTFNTFVSDNDTALNNKLDKSTFNDFRDNNDFVTSTELNSAIQNAITTVLNTSI